MSIKTTAVHVIANAAAWLVSCRRELVQHTLTDDECEAAGLPLGSTERAVHLHPLAGIPAWCVSGWIDGPEMGPEGCLQLVLLGYSVEVFYVRRATHVVIAG